MTSRNIEMNKTGELIATHWSVEKYQKKEVERLAKKGKCSESCIVRGILDEAFE